MLAPSLIDAAVKQSAQSGGVDGLVESMRDVAIIYGVLKDPGGAISRGAGASNENDLIEHQIHVEAPSLRRPIVAGDDHFSLRRYVPFAQRLLSKVAADHLSLMSEEQKGDAFDSFFDGEACPQVGQHLHSLPLRPNFLRPPRMHAVCSFDAFVHGVVTQAALPALHALVGAIGRVSDDFTMQQARRRIQRRAFRLPISEVLHGPRIPFCKELMEKPAKCTCETLPPPSAKPL